MYARVATYRGTHDAELDAVVGGLRDHLEERLAADAAGEVQEAMVLVDREAGTALVITLFETEESLQRGDEALSRVPLSQGGGVRTDVARYEVALRGRRP